MSNTLKLPRVDIQALRGLAVLLVVLYHTKIGSVAGGYLGVDVFFVISGYLITTLVASGIERGTFRLKDFYFKRAKRLLPAAYVTFATTAILAPWFLNQQELRDFGIQILGAVTFTGNFVLWQQTGYFEGAGDLKPLLHVWSLAIEEQYYFLLPSALLLIKPSRWLAGAAALALVSLGLCILGVYWKPIATFYLLPTRAWELLFGSVGALLMLRNFTNEESKIASGVRVLFIPSLLCLLVLPFMPLKGSHPGANAVLICLATLIVILRNSPWLNSALPTKLLAKIGDFSYSLYLVHWPIISFVKNSWVGSTPEVPLALRLTTLGLSFLLAYLLYRFIEDPIRRRNFSFSKPLFRKLALSSLLLCSITPVAMYAMPAQIDFKEVRRTNYGFSEKCDFEIPFAPSAECQSSGKPNLLVWGDSFAMHLVPGLVNEWTSGGVIQATRSQCGPFLGLAPRRVIKPEQGTYIDQSWAESCIDFNKSVVDFLRITPSIQTVVLSSPISQYVTKENYQHVVQEGGKFVSKPISSTNALSSLQRTVEEIRKLGKRVVFVAPPPSSDFNIGGCLERQLSGTVAFGGQPDCAIDRAEYESKRANVIEFLNRTSVDADIAVIRFDPWLCGASVCKTLLEGTAIYRDTGHLSHSGSKLMAKRMRLEQLIREQAK